jgi:signal peptidase I
VFTVTAPKGLVAELLEVVLLALGLYLAINFAVQTVHVIGTSMLPTVQDQDYLIANKLDYRFHNPQRGDIIIMRDPLDQSRDFIKRVIAVPGERLLIRDGQVYVNGRLLNEPYINHQEQWTQYASWPASPGDPQGQLMGAGEYFVMGDNRNHSSDSRVFGVVRRDQIEAKAWVRVLPLSHFGFVDGQKPTLSEQVSVPAAA